MTPRDMVLSGHVATSCEAQQSCCPLSIQFVRVEKDKGNCSSGYDGAPYLIKGR